MNKILIAFFSCLVIQILPQNALSQPFKHPGIDQSIEDLDLMKKLVLNGDQPWKDAFERLKKATDIDFIVKPYEHVMRGPYGKPNIGGDDLARGADMAYNCALIWFITNDSKYAEKSIQVLNEWSPVLRDFDFNDAKLLAGWTGYKLCNAAEILRSTASGWEKEDIEKFTHMLMSVYYPLLRFYYPAANGNWDGAIIHSILAIGIFTDNREMFNNGIEHFIYGPVNGSIFKYIYPSGQCQESPRDQGHVQLGLGEFAGAAQVAYTQGVDLFSIGNNRIALGYEYTAGYLLGRKPQCYGVISPRAMNFRDDYEYVYRHYASKGLDLPFTKQAADSVRPRATRSVLTAVRASFLKTVRTSVIPVPGKTGYPAGAELATGKGIPPGAVFVSPGESLQKALDEAAGTSRWIVAKAGVHSIQESLSIPSGITLAGEGLQTIIIFDKSPASRDLIINKDKDLHDVTIRDLVVEAAVSPETPSDPNSIRSLRNPYNRGGIIFRSSDRALMKNINLINVTVRACTYNGVFISGAAGVTVTGCDFTENGATVVPGPKLQHNLLITYSSEIKISGSRFDTSPFGSGLVLDHCNNVTVFNCEIARNAFYGVLISESSGITLQNNLVEGNDKSGIMIEFLHRGSEGVIISKNEICYNNGFGLESFSAKNLKIDGNTITGNNSVDQQKISDEKYIIMK